MMKVKKHNFVFTQCQTPDALLCLSSDFTSGGDPTGVGGKRGDVRGGEEVEG
jgi:hypothetical protein